MWKVIDRWDLVETDPPLPLPPSPLTTPPLFGLNACALHKSSARPKHAIPIWLPCISTLAGTKTLSRDDNFLTDWGLPAGTILYL